LPDVIEIGGLALNGMLLTALIAALAGYGALRLWSARASGGRSGPWGDLTTGAAAIAIAIWKFGVLLREPSLLWEQPGLLLVLVGSGLEAALGLAAAAIFWIWLAHRNGVAFLLALDALAVSAAGGLLAWNLLSAVEYRWGYAAVCAALLALLIGRQAPDAARAAKEPTGEKTAGAGGTMTVLAGRTANGDTTELAGQTANGDIPMLAGRTANGDTPIHAVQTVNGDRTVLAKQTADAGATESAGQTAVGDVSGNAEQTAGGSAAGTSEKSADTGGARRAGAHGEAAVLAGYALGAGCLVVSLFAPPPPWVKPPMLAGLTSTQLLFIAAGLAAAALDAFRSKAGG